MPRADPLTFKPLWLLSIIIFSSLLQNEKKKKKRKRKKRKKRRRKYSGGTRDINKWQMPMLAIVVAGPLKQI